MVDTVTNHHRININYHTDTTQTNNDDTVRTDQHGPSDISDHSDNDSDSDNHIIKDAHEQPSTSISYSNYHKGEQSSRSKRKNTRGERFTDRTPDRTFIWDFISCRPTYFAWWNALSFLIGSILFVINGIAYLCPMTSQLNITYGCIGLAGACFFTLGSLCQVLEVLQAPVEVKQHRDEHKNVNATQFNELAVYDDEDVSKKPVTKQRAHNGFTILRDNKLSYFQRCRQIFGQWQRIDYTLAVIQLMGALLYNINAVTQAGLYPTGVDPTLNSPIFWGLTVFPDITGSILFTVSGYLQVMESTHKVLPNMIWNDIGCWAGYNNMLGGVGFLVNAICYIYAQSALLPNIPLLVGSIFYLFASMIQWYEQCK